MMPPDAIDRLDWAGIAAHLDAEGWARLPGLPGVEAARLMTPPARLLPDRVPPVSLASVGLGAGELFCFGDTLPAPWDAWRRAFHRHLARIAERWNERLGISRPPFQEQQELFSRPRHAGRGTLPCHLSRLRAGDHLMLHSQGDRGAAGEPVLPLQVVALLSEPGKDFHGGEFVMTEQRPRMQSRPMVLPLRLGDAAVIATGARPVRGGRGDYRVNLKHAISRVLTGERISVVLSFPAALPAAVAHGPATGTGRRTGRAG